MEEIMMKVKFVLDLYGLTPYVMGFVLIVTVGAVIRAFMNHA